MYIDILGKTFILYFYIAFCYRLMGKKEIGQLSIIDLIVTILIAELAAMSIEEENSSIMISILPIALIVLLQIGLSYLSLKNIKFRDFFEGKPQVIINKGKVNFDVMRKSRYSLDDLILQLREKGIKSIENVNYAILENNGTLSVFDDNNIYPMPIIVDGVINVDTVKNLNKNINWVYKKLGEKNININDVFYAFIKNDKLFLIKKDKM